MANRQRTIVGNGQAGATSAIAALHLPRDARPAAAEPDTLLRSGIGRGLIAAALLHIVIVTALLLDLHAASMRQMGETNGDKDAVAVDVIDAGQFSAMMANPGNPGGPTPPSASMETAAAEPEESPAAQPPATHSSLRPSAPPAAAPVAKPEEPAQAPAPPPKPQDTLDDLEQQALDMLKQAVPQQAAPPSPAAKPAKERAAASKTGTGRRADLGLDLKMPPLSTLATGTAAGMMRPEGITRSGENDDFGRGVIAALRRTMPPADGQKTELTVRILLDEKGNLQDVKVTRPSPDRALDQSVLFAVKQSNFPIPPGKSTALDRTFIVTYLYR